MAELSYREAVQMVSCLSGQGPYRSAGRALVRAALGLPDSSLGAAVRSLVCCEVFHATERILSGRSNPVPPFVGVLRRAAQLMRAAAPAEAWRGPHLSRGGTVEEQTGSHYGALFSLFEAREYYDEAYRLLTTRLRRNGFDFDAVQGRRALDAGCGGGRYTVALKRLGFRSVTGVDFSPSAIRDARARLRQSGIRGVTYKVASVLKLPFPKNSFDFVFSNGVLHHTRDMRRGVEELLRVLKPGGRGFLYVIEEPGGIFWDVIEFLRVVMKPVPYAFARRQFALLGVPPNRTFYILDHVMVPINIRSTPGRVELLLRNAGATNIVRLERGTDFDRAERIHRAEPFARVKFGVGENRYFFLKP